MTTTPTEPAAEAAGASRNARGEVAMLLARAERALHPHINNVNRMAEWRDRWELEGVWTSCYDEDRHRADRAARNAGLLLQQAHVWALADLAQAANRIAAALEQAPPRHRWWR